MLTNARVTLVRTEGLAPTRLTTVRVSEGRPILSAEILLNRHKNVDTFFFFSRVQGIFNFL